LEITKICFIDYEEIIYTLYIALDKYIRTTPNREIAKNYLTTKSTC